MTRAAKAASPPPHPPTEASGHLRGVAGLLLAALVLILALRMTGGEQLRDTINQRIGWLSLPAGDRPVVVGPAIITAEGALTFFVAAGAAGVAAAAGRLSARRLGQLGLIGAVLGCGVVSMLGAANRFSAAVGLADLGMGVAAGWTVAVLLPLVGEKGRRGLVAGVLGILAIWVGKGLLQKYVEFPDVAALLRENQEQVLRNAGVGGDPVQSKLFLSRAAGGEVFGYLAGLANVLAAGLMGMLTVGTAVLVGWIQVRRMRPAAAVEPSPALRKPAGAASEPRQISMDALCFGLGCVLMGLGFFVLSMTGSLGGTALGLAASLAVAAGGFAWRQVLAWRKVLIPLCVGALVVGAIGVALYGMRNDTLPSKSLMFRWHYWTASAPLVREHPAWGVGLNNFGDYYLQYKRPSSPEDVKDPHNFFMRLASEMGLPATLLMSALIVWMMAGALRRGAEVTEGAGGGDGAALGIAVVTAGLWAVGHLLFFEAAKDFNIYVTLIFAALAVGAFYMGMTLLRPSGEPRGAESLARSQGFPVASYLAIAAAIGAVAMLLYDQINMALVTGPVAMLFWMLLGYADAGEARTIRGDRRVALRAWLGAGACGALGAAGVVVMAGLWIPVARGTMPWDPAPHEEAFILAAQRGDDVGARQALEAALARAPRSLEVRMKLIGLLSQRFPGAPLAPLIREALALDRANAQVALQLGMLESDLPAAERVAALRRALELDAQVPAEEYKRLSPAVIAAVRAKVAELEGRGQGGN